MWRSLAVYFWGSVASAPFDLSGAVGPVGVPAGAPSPPGGTQSSVVLEPLLVDTVTALAAIDPPLTVLLSDAPQDGDTGAAPGAPGRRSNRHRPSSCLRENGMELFAAFAGLAPARGGQAVALAWKGLRPDAGCSMRFRARRGGGLSAAAAAVGTLSCCRPVPASGCRYRAAAGDVVSAACGRGSGRVDVVV